LPVLSLCTYSLAGLVFFVFDLLALELIRGFVVLLIWNAPTIILLLERRWVPVLRQQRMARKAAAQAPRQF
jgi:hypothetical protein